MEQDDRQNGDSSKAVNIRPVLRSRVAGCHHGTLGLRRLLGVAAAAKRFHYFGRTKELRQLTCTRIHAGGVATHVLAVFIRLGAVGLLTFGFLDSLILVFQFGNDILLILLVAGKRNWFPIYTACATVGSIAGTLVLDLLTRKGGEEGLKKVMKPQQVKKLKKRIGERAGMALALASLAPPPFPFTPVIAAASAFQYPRRRLPAVVAAASALRFLFSVLPHTLQADRCSAS
jgi:membrane protein YqaA with SNARE-associated domain